MLRLTLTTATAALMLAAPPARADDLPPRSDAIEASGMLGVERVELPRGEGMGLVGGSVIFGIGDGWGLGPAVYGAASGRRGGLFVGGIEVQKRWALARNWTLATGLFAGGGGGAAAPVGSGLMWRPAVTVLYDLTRELQLGASVSHVRFPSGDIASTQAGLVLAWRTDFRHFVDAEPGDRIVSSRASGLGFDRMVATVGSYEFRRGPARPNVGLIGARAEKRSSFDGLVWGLEAAGAARGDAEGYMEILGTAAWSAAPLADALPRWRVGLRLSAGLGGGGAVPTEGGVIGKAALGTEIGLMPGWSAGVELGVVRAASGDFAARQLQGWIGVELEPGLDGRSAPEGRVVRHEWSAAWQHHARIERKDGDRRPLDTIGLRLARYVGPNVYVTGQAHSAFGGGAGAYAIGLVGAGVATSPKARWRAGAELLAGAAGGGGVEASGGALTQALAWAGWSPAGGDGEFRLGLGQVRYVRSGSSSPSFELSWTKAFGMAGR